MSILNCRVEGIAIGGATLVLASGGLDSSTLLAILREQGINASALFVDYGQASAKAEEAAATTICDEYCVPLTVARYRGTRFGPGEIRGRNAFLLQTALMEFPGRSGAVTIGIHSGTGYRDCSRGFMELMQGSFEFHTGGAISVCAPFVTWTKREIFDLAVYMRVPIKKTYSCESGSEPCGKCRSCLDRIALGLEGPNDRT